MKNFKKLTMYDESIETTTSNSTAPLLGLDNVMQWVAVKDELPPVEVDVLVWDEFNIYVCNRLDEKGIVWDESTQILDNVTHWTHLPEPPCV